MVFKSVQQTEGADHFDFFILSDSNQPNQWIREEVAWAELCKQVGGFGKIFYRKRRQAINKKAGNVADFLRRWGRNYRYMVVLDADSVMTGEALVEARHDDGGQPVGRDHPDGAQDRPRASRSTRGSRRSRTASTARSSWRASTTGSSTRATTGATTRCCACSRSWTTARCPTCPETSRSAGGSSPTTSSRPRSCARPGWAVWLAHDVEGSYEEGPPTLIESAKRDRRWCQGNLQHAWLLTARGFRPANRFHLLMGIMAYVSSPLWLLFLILSTVEMVNRSAPQRRSEARVLLRRHDVAVRLHGRHPGGAHPVLADDAPAVPAEVRERRRHARPPGGGGPLRGPRAGSWRARSWRPLSPCSSRRST